MCIPAALRPTTSGIELRFWQKPRMLYFFLFAYLSSSGGRFSSLLFPTFWQVDGEEVDPSLLGTFFAFYWLTYSVATPLASLLSDSYNINPTNLIITCLVISLSSFSLHFFVEGASFELHVTCRCVYSAAVGPIMSKLDGFTLQFLQRHSRGVDASAQFGKERLWGAVSWAIANV